LCRLIKCIRIKCQKISTALEEKWKTLWKTSLNAGKH
jgi:hypothetical protein